MAQTKSMQNSISVGRKALQVKAAYQAGSPTLISFRKSDHTKIKALHLNTAVSPAVAIIPTLKNMPTQSQLSHYMCPTTCVQCHYMCT